MPKFVEKHFWLIIGAAAAYFFLLRPQHGSHHN